MFDLPKTFGRYRLVEFLGQGAMAEVYRATLAGPLGFSKSLAVKIVPPSVARDEHLVAAMVNEARVGARLSHANVVHIVDFNQHEGHFYLAMEFIDGVNLDDLLGWFRRRHRLLPPQAAMEIARQTCAGLAHAHTLTDASGQPLHLIHRDLKPGNLRINLQGVVKILDFGIARSADRFGAATSVGITKGTPLYMSPEQVSGGELSPASDLFALGAVLYEMVTLKQLFSGENLAHILNQVLKADVSAAADEMEERAPGLGAVLRRATCRRISERYAHATAMEDDLEEILRRDGVNGRYDLRALVGEARLAAREAEALSAAETRRMSVPPGMGTASGEFPALGPVSPHWYQARWPWMLALGVVVAGALGQQLIRLGEESGEALVGAPEPGGAPAVTQAVDDKETPREEEALTAVGSSPLPALATGRATTPSSSAPLRPGTPPASVPEPTPAPGRLLLDGDTFFYVSIDGGPALESPVDQLLSPGDHTLEFRAPKHPEDARRETVEMKVGGEIRRYLRWKPEPR